MNTAAAKVLVGAYRYNAARGVQCDRSAGRRRTRAVARRCEALDRFCARLDYAAWLGRKPTCAERMALWRAVVQLEEQGLLVRLNGRGGNRTTHVLLTEHGQAEALRILTDAVEMQPIEMPWKDEDNVPAQ